MASQSKKPAPKAPPQVSPPNPMDALQQLAGGGAGAPTPPVGPPPAAPPIAVKPPMPPRPQPKRGPKKGKDYGFTK